MQDNSYIDNIITNLLDAIDQQDWDALSSLLHDDTEYEVTGFPLFRGKAAVIHYYESLRPVRSGSHRIDTIIKDRDCAVCCGQFTGTKKNGEEIDLLFSDVLKFEDNKIRQRRVYFCIPEDD